MSDVTKPIDLAVVPAIKFNAYAIIERAVEEGVRYGYMRAHKYDDKPSEDTMVTEMERGVMNALCEILEFGD